MKRKMFSIMAIAAIAVASCKKEEPVAIELGTAVITGNVWADLNQSNDIQNGVYVQGLNPEGVNGMQVSAEIDTRDLDQSPNGDYDYEIRTFTAVTNSAGDYTLTLPATDDAFPVTISYQDVFAAKTILAEDGSTYSEEVKVSLGSTSKSIFAGAIIVMKDAATVTPVNQNPANYGTAKIFGTVYVNWNDGVASTDFYEIGDVTSPMAGKTISWAYSQGPYGEGEDIWTEVAIATDGTYEIDLTTEGAGLNPVAIKFGFFDFIADQVTVSDFGGNALTPSIYTVGGLGGISQGGLVSGQLVPNVHILVDVNNI